MLVWPLSFLMTHTKRKGEGAQRRNYSTGLFSSEMRWVASFLRPPDVWKDNYQFKHICDTICLEKVKSCSGI